MRLRTVLLGTLVLGMSVVAWQSFQHRTLPTFSLHASPTIVLDAEPPEFGATIRADLASGNFQALDAMAAEFRRPDARFFGGILKLEVFYGRLTEYGRTMTSDGPVAANPDGPDFEVMRAQLEKWHAAEPSSNAAGIALTKLWELRAWDARQHGFTDTVTEERWAQIAVRLTNAERYLIDADPASDPVALFEAIQIGALRSYGSIRMRELYDRAIKLFPWYDPYYAQHAIFFEPSWFGRPWEAQHYLNELSRDGDEGEVRYSFAALRLLQHYQFDQILRDFGLGYDAVIAAFQTRERLYGLRGKDWNAVFQFGIVGRDCRTILLAYDQMHGRRDAELWPDAQSFKQRELWLPSCRGH